MLIRKSVLVAVIALGVTIACSSLIAADFTAELLMSQPNDSMTVKLYVKGSLYRVEKLTGNNKMLIIENRDTDITTAMNPEEKTYLEIEGKKGAFVNPVKGWEQMKGSTDETLAGTETIRGYECEHYTYAYPGEAEPAMEIWKSNKLDHFIKWVLHLDPSSGDASMEVLNIVEGPLDDALFKIPPEYSRQKTAEEIELERPALTLLLNTEAPVGRRMAAGGQLIVKTDPTLSSRVEMRNLTRDTSICKVSIYKNGKLVEESADTKPSEQEFTLKFNGDRAETFFGSHLEVDEIRIALKTGRAMVTVYHEYSSFDDTNRRQYYVNPPGRGLACIEGHSFHIKMVGDSPFAESSKVRVHAYQQEFVDGSEQKNTIEQIEFDLKNGEIKELQYPADKNADYINIEIDDGGGLKVFTEQP